MIKDIDYYIKEKEIRGNISMSSSPAYSFDEDDVILVQYSISREKIEEISQILRKLKKEGVNTPLYLAYKRDYENGLCYVLQEKAKGEVFSNFTREATLKDLEYVSNIPQEHYEKFISDVIKMQVLGIELRPRNFFYDEKIGFTIIDIQGTSDGKYDSKQLGDVVYKYKHISSAFNINVQENLTEEQKEKEKKLKLKKFKKITQAFENALPGFKENERWIFRGFLKEGINLDELKDFGYDENNLKLTEEEKKKLYEIIDYYAEKHCDLIKNGYDSSKIEYLLFFPIYELEGSLRLYPECEYTSFNKLWGDRLSEAYKKAIIKNSENEYLKESFIRKTMYEIDPFHLKNQNSLYNSVKQALEKYLEENETKKEDEER